VPSSWQLVRRGQDGTEEIIAKNVLAYDLDAKGNIVYSNGNAIFHLTTGGKRGQILSAAMIEQVVFMEGPVTEPASATT
jgi:hypothetical protein